MQSFWHSISGRYNTTERWIGLDYKSLFLDPVIAKITYVHEITHSVLGSNTDFGLATQTIHSLLPHIASIDEVDKRKIYEKLYESQLFVQEGSASLMEMLMHRSYVGKERSIIWAFEHLPYDYLDRLKKLMFVMDMGKRYREEFTKKISHLAMHTGIRKAIVEYDLFKKPNNFISYLDNEDNNPDKRFMKLIDLLHYNQFLVTKDVREIADRSGIKFFPDVTKRDVANFLNYMHDLTKNKHYYFTEDDIKDAPQGGLVIQQASNNTFIANMNLNIVESSIALWEIDDIINYSDVTEAVFVTRLSDDWDYKSRVENLLNKKYEVGFLAFTRTCEKYLIGLDTVELSRLLKNEFNGKTLIVKWGLYDIESKDLNYFPNSRKPDVVIYNTVQDLRNKFKSWFNKNNKADYVVLNASENHPFHSLVLNVSDVIHFVNTFGNKDIEDFIRDYNVNLIKTKPNLINNFRKHLNNLLSIWMGLDWDVDWYETMINKEYVVYRK